MTRQLHCGPAAAAITLILCVACFSFLILVLLPALAGTPTIAPHSRTIPAAGVHIRNITRSAGVILILGYVAGMMGWVVLFAAHRDGRHRLTLLLSERGWRLRLR